MWVRNRLAVNSNNTDWVSKSFLKFRLRLSWNYSLLHFHLCIYGLWYPHYLSFFVESECVKIVSWNGRLWIVKGTRRFDAMICRNWPYGPVAKHDLFSSGHTKAKKHWCLKMVYIMVYPKIAMFRKGKWWETDGIEDTSFSSKHAHVSRKAPLLQNYPGFFFNTLTLQQTTIDDMKNL